MATIKKRGNSYLLRCYDGYGTNGRQIEKTMTWNIPEGMSEKKAEKEALHQAALFEERVRNGQIADGKVKFQDFAERWFTDYADIQLRPTTIDRYRDMTVRIYPAIGHLYMDKIRPAHLMTFYKELSKTIIRSKCHCKIDLKAQLKKEGIRKVDFAEKADVSLSVISSVFQGKNTEIESGKKISAALNGSYDAFFEDEGTCKPLSAKTVQHYHRLIASIMASAVKWQVIVANPCDRVDPPKVQKAEIEHLDDVQAIQLLDLLCKEAVPVQYRSAVEVLLFTGMRRGELLGLEWSDIDFDSHLVNIHQSSLYLKDKGIFDDDTKNTSSNRIIKAPSAAMKALRAVRVWQAKQRLLLGSEWNDSGKVFTALDGSPMHPDTLSGWFHDYIEAHPEFPQIHLYSLRHNS